MERGKKVFTNGGYCRIEGLKVGDKVKVISFTKGDTTYNYKESGFELGETYSIEGIYNSTFYYGLKSKRGNTRLFDGSMLELVSPIRYIKR